MSGRAIICTFNRENLRDVRWRVAKIFCIFIFYGDVDAKWFFVGFILNLATENTYIPYLSLKYIRNATLSDINRHFSLSQVCLPNLIRNQKYLVSIIFLLHRHILNLILIVEKRHDYTVSISSSWEYLFIPRVRIVRIRKSFAGCVPGFVTVWHYAVTWRFRLTLRHAVSVHRALPIYGPTNWFISLLLRISLSLTLFLSFL